MTLDRIRNSLVDGYDEPIVSHVLISIALSFIFIASLALSIRTRVMDDLPAVFDTWAPIVTLASAVMWVILTSLWNSHYEQQRHHLITNGVTIPEKKIINLENSLVEMKRF